MIPAFTIVRIAMASLSCSCSTLIAAMICRAGTAGLRTSYSRIIFGLSISDIILSASIIASTFAVPKSLSDSSWVVGTNGSCETVAFTIIAGNSAVLLYTVFLTFYFLQRVKFNMSPKLFSERYEHKIHALIWICAVGGAMFALFRKDYNPVSNMDGYGDSSICMIADFPQNCVLDPETYGPCTRGEHYMIDALFVIALPTALTFMALVVILCLFTSHIHNQESMLTSPSSHQSAQGSSTRVSESTPTDEAATVTAIGNGNEHEHEQLNPRRRSISCWAFLKLPCSLRTATPQDATSPTTTIAISTSDEAGRRRLLGLLAKKSAVQSSLYIFVFIACYFFPLVLFFASEQIKSERVSRLLLFSGTSVFWPLGGFLNIIVYTRPKVSKFKRDNPQYVDFPWVFIFIAVVCCGGEVPEIDVEEVIPSSELLRNENANANDDQDFDRDFGFYLEPLTTVDYEDGNGNGNGSNGNGNGNGNGNDNGNSKSGSGIENEGAGSGSIEEGNESKVTVQQTHPIRYSTPFVSAVPTTFDTSNPPSRMQYSTPFVKAPQRDMAEEKLEHDKSSRVCEVEEEEEEEGNVNRNSNGNESKPQMQPRPQQPQPTHYSTPFVTVPTVLLQE